GAGLDTLSTMMRAAADGQPFSLVLLDANMPDVDSLALANKIVAEMANSQIVLMTTQSEPDLAIRLCEPSVAAVVLKPLLRDELVEAICRILAGLNQSVAEPQHAGGCEVYENPAIDLSPGTSALQ